MRVMNATSDAILIFVYDVGDPAYFAAMRNPDLHLLVLANNEVPAGPGQAATLTHRSARQWLVGIKSGGTFGRFEPFICPLTPDVHTAASRIEVRPGGVLAWFNGPKPEPPPTPHLPKADFERPLPPAPTAPHVIGLGKASITDSAVGHADSALPLQGWASPSQLSTELGRDDDNNELPLQARAFLIGHPASETRVVFVVADIWSCSIAIKQEVLRRISSGPESRYRPDNVWISGTHTHSGPGGYLHHFLYNATGLGFDPHVFECVVDGIVSAIEAAHGSLGPGRVRLTRGRMETRITANRSLDAFVRNPQAERDLFPRAVDDTMTQLVFDRMDGNGRFEAAGALNWFAIHPTNHGSDWTTVSGDNKGLAAHRLEIEQRRAGRRDFVAGFANACCGDVSGNLSDPAGPVFAPSDGKDMVAEDRRMRSAAEAQKELAGGLLDGGVELGGTVLSLEHRLDLVRRSGTIGTLGLSFPAGSTEDGGTGVLPEGITLSDPLDPFRTSLGQLGVGALSAGLLLPAMHILAAVTALFSGRPLAAVQALSSIPITDPVLIAQHHPKPILLASGMMAPVSWTPEVLPLQLVRIGSFAALGVSMEVTTVAGLRLEQAIAPALASVGVEHRVVGTYTNGYGHYLTTREEYESQQYEGASTLYGPNSCDILANGASELADAVSGRAPLLPDAPLPDLSGSVLTKRRMTFRNFGDRMRFRLFFPWDSARRLVIWPGGDFELDGDPADGIERALTIPLPYSIILDQVQILCQSSGRPARQLLFAATSDLVLVRPDNRVIRAAYFPTDRRLT